MDIWAPRGEAAALMPVIRAPRRTWRARARFIALEWRFAI